MQSFLSILALWLSIFVLPAQANMAAPQQTTPAYHPFISKHVDILHETIQIFPAPDLRHSKMVIEYHIQSEESKEQVPLLFYAYNIKDDFQIEIFPFMKWKYRIFYVTKLCSDLILLQ